MTIAIVLLAVAACFIARDYYESMRLRMRRTRTASCATPAEEQASTHTTTHTTPRSTMNLPQMLHAALTAVSTLAVFPCSFIYALSGKEEGLIAFTVLALVNAVALIVNKAASENTPVYEAPSVDTPSMETPVYETPLAEGQFENGAYTGLSVSEPTVQFDAPIATVRTEEIEFDLDAEMDAVAEIAASFAPATDHTDDSVEAEMQGVADVLARC